MFVFLRHARKQSNLNKTKNHGENSCLVVKKILKKNTFCLENNQLKKDFQELIISAKKMG